MSKIRSEKTGLEKYFLKLLKKSIKIPFKTYVKEIKGKPDIVFTRQQLCVFLDGDFWHGWQFPRWKHQMKNNYWKNKIEENRKRDWRTMRVLRGQGWRVLRLWEHRVHNDPQYCIEKIQALLGSSSKNIRQ